MTQPLKITASCQPVPAEDGTQTLNCAGTLTNQTTETVEVVVLGAVPGQQVLDVRGYTLPAGGNVNIPAPPSGGFWVIAAHTKGAISVHEFWGGLGQYTLWGLAGWGAGSIISSVVQSIARHRRGY